MTTEKKPYVGPCFFKRGDESLFFGRDREISDLLSLIIVHGDVLVYAQSGTGKTSLLNAGVIPQLEEKGFDILPIPRLRDPIPESIKPEEIANLYVFNTLMSWVETIDNPNLLLEKTLSDYLKNRKHTDDKYKQPLPRIAIFDQFEELFSFYPERWPDRLGFFEQVRDALDDDPLLRVVFIIREEYLAQLDPYARILPEKFRTRFRLERMRKDAALSAVVKPLDGTGRSYVEGVAEELVDKLRGEIISGKIEPVLGEFVEPMLLQVVCKTLWDALPINVVEITEKHLQEIGDINKALSTFYLHAITAVSQKTDVKSGVIRLWFENQLVTSSRTRDYAHQGIDDTEKLPNKVIKELEDLHLIRSERRHGSTWYEIIHDTFVEPILQSNEEWLPERKEVDEMRKNLEIEASRWVKSVRNEKKLIAGSHYYEAKRYFNKLDNAELSYSTELKEWLEASEEAIQNKKRKKRRQVMGYATQALAAQAIRLYNLGQYEQSALLARQAYIFNKCYRGTHLSQVDDALRIALSGEYFSHLLYEHDCDVLSVAFSPDGHLFATGTSDGKVRIWNRDDPHEEAKVLGSHKKGNGVMDLAFSSDSRTLASASVDKNVLLWNPYEIGIKPEILSHEDEVFTVDFNLDGRILASGSKDGTVRLWNLSLHDGSIPYEVLGKCDGKVFSVAFSPSNGNFLAAGSGDEGGDGAIQIWDLRKRPCYTRASLSDKGTGEIYSVAFNPQDDDILASGSEDGIIRLWNWQYDDVIPTPLRGHKTMVKSIAFSPDGEIIASVSQDFTLRLWKWTSQHPDIKPIVLKDFYYCNSNVAFSPDNLLVTTGFWDKKVIFWDLHQSGAKPKVLSGSDIAYSVAFSRERILAAGCKDSIIRIWHPNQDDPNILTGHDEDVRAVAFSPEGSRLVSGSNDKTVRLWNPYNPYEESKVIGSHEQGVTTVTFSPNGKIVASGCWDGAIHLWDTDHPEVILERLNGHENVVWMLAFSPNDDSKLASSSRDGTVRLWKVGEVNSTLVLNHGFEVRTVSFSPDGKKLATGGKDGIVRLFDLDRLECFQTQTRLELNDIEHLELGHLNPGISSLAFSPIDQVLAAGYWDQTVQLWDLDKTQEYPIVVLRGHEHGLSTVAFSLDGRLLASGSYDKTICIWIAQAENLAEMVCERVWRNLSMKEWQRALGEDIPYERTCGRWPSGAGVLWDAPDIR